MLRVLANVQALKHQQQQLLLLHYHRILLYLTRVVFDQKTARESLSESNADDPKESKAFAALLSSSAAKTRNSPRISNPLSTTAYSHSSIRAAPPTLDYSRTDDCNTVHQATKKSIPESMAHSIIKSNRN